MCGCAAIYVALGVCHLPSSGSSGICVTKSLYTHIAAPSEPSCRRSRPCFRYEHTQQLTNETTETTTTRTTPQRRRRNALHRATKIGIFESTAISLVKKFVVPRRLFSDEHTFQSRACPTQNAGTCEIRHQHTRASKFVCKSETLFRRRHRVSHTRVRACCFCGCACACVT